MKLNRIKKLVKQYFSGNKKAIRIVNKLKINPEEYKYLVFPAPKID